MSVSLNSGDSPPVALVTGTAGFVGFHLVSRLLKAGWRVVGVDGFTPYYDRQLKEDRNALLCRSNRFSLERFMIEDGEALQELVAAVRPQLVVHLAAQAGVRYSIENPLAYINGNVVGTYKLLEACRACPPRHLMIASTSSVYGAAPDAPFKETQTQSSQPLSIYAATKKSTEVIAHAYSHLFGLPVTMFRFFTVYGPWGRPDMALFKFTRAILEGQPIEVYGDGSMVRDFTFIDDLIDGIMALAECIPVAGCPAVPEDAVSPSAPYRMVNIGAGRPRALEEFIAAIEEALERPATRIHLPVPPGDVPATHADTLQSAALTGINESTPLEVGVKAFVAWYRTHYAV